MNKLSLILLSVFFFFFSENLPAQNIRKGDNFYRNKVAEVTVDKKFTAKVVESCDRPINYSGDTLSYFIGLKTPVLPPDTTMELKFPPIYVGCSYYWNEIFNKYSNEDKIKILEELLEYENDTDLSGTKVAKYGFINAGTALPKTVSYTLQTEALYIITLLAMSESSPAYCPYPVLINTKTNKEINNYQKQLKKVFGIYKKWIKDNKKNGFVNFKPPLIGTNYKWYGGVDYPLNHKIDNLHSPGMVVGERRN